LKFWTHKISGIALLRRFLNTAPNEAKSSLEFYAESKSNKLDPSLWKGRETPEMDVACVSPK